MYTASTTFRPVLEALEDRWTPAAPAFTAPVAALAPSTPAVTAVGGQSGPSLPGQTIGQTTGQVTSLFASLLTLATQPPQTSATLPGLSTAAGGLQQSALQAALGFRGRLALPGTGVQQRVGTGDGPFDQPPGVYLSGGGNEEQVIAPVPRRPMPELPNLLGLFGINADQNVDDAAGGVKPAPAGGADASPPLPAPQQP
jgi:hypothetical protein